MKCKNIECVNETVNKRVYCSLACRNIYVNKYLRDYSKNSNSVKNSYKDKYKPNNCKLCDSAIPYEYRESNYCSKECSKSIININRKELGLKYNLSSEGLESLRKTAFENFNSKDDVYKNKYCLSPNKCKFCHNDLIYAKRTRIFCSKECCSLFKRKDKDLFKVYKYDTHFKFNLKDYPDEFDFSLIEVYGWYSPSNKKNNLGGVSRDHMLSVREGFELGIDPKLLSHPANCRLLIHNENISKNKNSSLTLYELLERIELFDKKYKNIERVINITAII